MTAGALDTPLQTYEGRTYPSYLALLETGELDRRADALWDVLRDCTLCPHNCRVDRTGKKRGHCRSGDAPVVASYTIHKWEEPPISGTRGTGTIFFSNCTMKCTFCQNYSLSLLGYGSEVTCERLGEMMLELQARGAHSIDLVTPTHYAPQIVRALAYAARNGLRIPMVYNTSGYENVEIVRLLDGIIDIYLPDAKWADDDTSIRYSRAENYVASNRAALREMYRQVGDLVVDDAGVAVRGLIVRHLVMPGDIGGVREILRFVAEELSPTIAVSVMDQYFPAHKALKDPTINRKLTWDEYAIALDAIEEFDFDTGWTQEHVMDEEIMGMAAEGTDATCNDGSRSATIQINRKA